MMHDTALWGLTEHHTYLLLLVAVIVAGLTLASMAASLGRRHACREESQADEEGTV